MNLSQIAANYSGTTKCQIQKKRQNLWLSAARVRQNKLIETKIDT